jgi:hypothetical protein
VVVKIVREVVEEADEELGEGLVVARIGSIPHAVHRLLRAVTPPRQLSCSLIRTVCTVLKWSKKTALALFCSPIRTF